MSLQTPDTIKKFQINAYNEAMINQPNMFLSSLFGRQPGSVTESQNNEVVVDIERDQERIAVDVNKGGFGNKNTGFLFTTNVYEPPLYDEYAPVTAAQVQKRLPGETGFEENNVPQRTMAHILRNQVKMSQKIKRAIELQASQVIFNGVINFTNGDDIDFNRLATHNITPANAWSDTVNGDPIADLLAACVVNRNDGKMKSDLAIMGSTAWIEFINHPKVREYLEGRRIEVGNIVPTFGAEDVTFQGVVWIGDYRLEIYTYPEIYKNAADAITYYVPAEEVAVMSSKAYLAKTYAATEMLKQDNDAYNQLGVPSIPIMTPGQMMPYAYVERKVILAGVQSAPLLIPVAIDTIAKINT